jgi:hypothetical protein
MADQLYLSYWLRGFNSTNMLRRYEKMLALFPFSKLSKKEMLFRVYAVSYAEPTVLEAAFPQPLDFEALLAAAKDFQNSDVCYELSAAWDLWQHEDDWKLGPSRVEMLCFGPDFENETGENLRIQLGLEDQFLPDENSEDGLPMIRSNIQSLLRLVHDLDERLPHFERRLLWPESGGNFAERLQESLGELR